METTEIISGIESIDNPTIVAIISVAITFFTLTKSAWIKLISSINVDSIIKLFSSIKISRGVKFDYSIKDLKMHDMFSELDSYKTYTHTFKSYHVVDETKTKVFKDFLNIKIENTAENIMSISQEANSKMSKATLKHLVHAAFNTCNLTLDKKLEDHFISKGLTKDTARVVIDKFFVIRQEAMERYERRIESIFACPFYETNFQLILAVYEMVAFELDDIIKHTVRTFESVNGLFFELEYK